MHNNSFNSYQRSNPVSRSVSYQNSKSNRHQSGSRHQSSGGYHQGVTDQQNSRRHQSTGHQGGGQVSGYIQKSITQKTYDTEQGANIQQYESDYAYNYPISPSKPVDDDVAVDAYEFGSQRGSQRTIERSLGGDSQSGSIQSFPSGLTSIRDGREATQAAELTCNCDQAVTATQYSGVQEAQETGLTCNCEIGKQESLSYDQVSSVSNSYDSYSQQHMVSENKTVRSEAMIQNEHSIHEFSGPELTSTPEPTEAIVEQERVNDDENQATIQMEYSRSIDGDTELNQVSFNDNIEMNFENELDANYNYNYEYNREDLKNQTNMQYNNYIDKQYINQNSAVEYSCDLSSDNLMSNQNSILEYNHERSSNGLVSNQNSTLEYNRELSSEGLVSNASNQVHTDSTITVTKDTVDRSHVGQVSVDVNERKESHSHTVVKGEKNSKISDTLQLTQLIELLQSNDKNLMSNAAGYIMHLVYNDDDAKKKIREIDLIPILVRLLDHDDEDVHRNAAGALKNLSYGQFMDDNKMAIYKCGGVAACSRLLHKTVWIEVREHVTGVLYNISTVKEIKHEILKETLEAVSVLVVIPLSGWEKESSIMGKKPGVISWSALLRNSTGVLRNVSSAGKDARIKIRGIEGLLDALVWILRAGIAEQQKAEINNKVIENIMCTLRNVSYKVDIEIDRDVYLDAIKQSTKGNNDDSHPSDEPDEITRTGNIADSSLFGENKMFGCMGMKKKPVKRRINSLKGKFSLRNNREQPPPEEWKYLIPVQEDNPVALGVELLWQPDLVTLYVHIITNSTNPITLEAAAGAIHNLCGCKWNWAGLHRIHIRLQKGIPPMHDLLTVDQDYVVRAVAYALRNMAIDATNKWSIGKFAYKTLLQVLPPPNAIEKDTEPCGYTICTILSVLQVLVYKSYSNSKYIKDGGGIARLVALTREGPRDSSDTSSLRLYSRRVVIEANRVLLYMWDFKECREAIQQKTWSHSVAVEMEKTYVNQTLQLKERGDTYALMKCGQEPAVYGRDLRRFVDVEEKENENVSAYKVECDDGEEIPMSDFANGEDSTRLARSARKKGTIGDSAV